MKITLHRFFAIGLAISFGLDSSATAQDKSAVGAATKDAPLVNSLGMEFVPVPGTKVLMCRTETRVQDFRAYAKASGYKQSGGAYVMKMRMFGNYSDNRMSITWELDGKAIWEQPGFVQNEKHPVVCVSWEEARAFCAWLSQKEGRTYRLPADAEWSAAVGMDKYPWGSEWPARKVAGKAAGNYRGTEFGESRKRAEWARAYDFSDAAEWTAEVAAYRPNRLGIFDLGGNVWEWCEDEYKAEMNNAEMRKRIADLMRTKTGAGEPWMFVSDDTPTRVVRGGAWNEMDEHGLRSSCRNRSHHTYRYDMIGFRCVLVVSGS